MLAGWGSRLPGVASLAKAHVHEFGAHKFHDGDGWCQSEHDRRGPWFFEVTPTDHEKLREVNIDSAGPVEELPLREIAAAIDDPFDDEEQGNFFSEDAVDSEAGGEVGERAEAPEEEEEVKRENAWCEER